MSQDSLWTRDPERFRGCGLPSAERLVSPADSPEAKPSEGLFYLL